jgi:hypothetical protein
MLRRSKNIQRYVQKHPVTAYIFAISLIIFASGVFLHIGGRYLVHAPGFADSLSLRYYLQLSGDHDASVFGSWSLFVQRVETSVCNLYGHAAGTFLHVGKRAREVGSVFIALADRHKTVSRQLLRHPWIARILSFQVLTVFALKALSYFSRRIFGSWIARRKAATAKTLYFVAFASFVVQRSNYFDWPVAALVMVSFDVFQRALDGDATEGNESRHQEDAPLLAVETLLEQPPSLVAESQIIDPPRRSLFQSQKGDPTSIIGPCDSNDRDVLRLQSQWSLTDLQTAIEAKDVELGVARQELLNAKQALTKSFADISALHNDMKTMKQTLVTQHQATIYRKDIELFALRKGNEQKERHMQEDEAQYNQTLKQQRITLELKEAQLSVLEERLAAMERRASPNFTQGAMFEENGSGDHALEVRLLRIKKGRRSLSGSSEEDKDAIIEQLKRELAAATRTAEDIVNQQAELQRAWNISKKIQNALKEERERHDQTKACLEEASAELEEAQAGRRRSRSDPSTGRLPTIEENDQNELEAMFDTAQQDNLRLHSEVEALDKRVREANSRVFLAEQEIGALREQLRLEHAINEDMEAARPSVVHPVHFQRLEGQLKESRNDIAQKEAEIQRLGIALAEKDLQLEAIRADMIIAAEKSETVQEEIERLKESVMDLEVAKAGLMQDHERLATQRSRHRVSSAEYMSARTSGATLINEHSPPPRLTFPDDVPPVPAMPMLGSPILNSVQQRDAVRSHRRNQSDSQRHSLVSDTNVVHSQQTKSRSGFGIRGMVKRIVRKDTSIEGVLHSPPLSSPQWGNRSTLASKNAVPKDASVSIRQRPLSLSSHPPAKDDVETMPRPIPRPISGPANVGARPRTNTAPTATIPRRFPSKKDLIAQHRPRTATMPVMDTQVAAAALPKAVRPNNPRRSSQPRYYTSPDAIAVDSQEDLRLKDARAQVARLQTAVSPKDLDKRKKHDSGIGAISDGEKSKLRRMSWGNTA